MKKLFALIFSLTIITLTLSTYASAATHTVIKGDTMWKIAVKYEIGLSEIINANPQISNPNLIYPGQVLNIPENNSEYLEIHLVGMRVYFKPIILTIKKIQVKLGSFLCLIFQKPRCRPL